MPRKKYDKVEKGKMLYDPNDPALYEKLKRYGEFDFDGLELNPYEVCRFIVLMYDMESPLRLEHLELWARKRAAAEMAGFKIGKSGAFDLRVEQMLLGENVIVNTAIAKYIMLFGLPEIASLEADQASMFFEVARSLKGEANKNTLHNIAFLRKEINALTEEVFGGSEAHSLRKALYGHLEDKRNSIKPEEVIKRLAAGDDLIEWSPYGDTYKPNNLTYGGDN